MFSVALMLLVFCEGFLFSECTNCDNSSFPANFKFGAGSSAYQIEGGWNAYGKGRSWWDWFLNSAGLPNGNTAADSCHKYKEDVAAMKEIGLDFYRFSLSWTRILPKGLTYEVNQAGVDYYNKLLDELEAAGIEPLVTIFHWDTPKSFDYLGQWTNPLIIDYFVAYADLAFKLFGTRVKLWATINEPKSFCAVIPEMIQGYAFSELPLGTYEYLCAHHALLAHAKTYRLYQRKYKITQKGKLGIVLDYNPNFPLTNSLEDLKAVERADAFDLRWLADPLVFGDYPQLVKDVVARNSAKQNFSTSRLPSFTLPEKILLLGAYDVLMINSYTCFLVTNAIYNNTPSYDNDKQIKAGYSADWSVGNSGFAVHTPGIRKLLQYLKVNFGNTDILITENGYSNVGGLNDTDRIKYLQAVLQQIRLAMCEDKVKITHYFYWSILDSLEWANGYKPKFGLVQVDFNSTDLKRTLKDSAYYYRDVIRTRFINKTLNAGVNDK